MGDGVSERRKVYDSEAELEGDRRKMWAEGWVVQEKRTVPGMRWRWTDWLNGELPVIVLVSPLILIGWLLFRNVPEEQIAVTYVRERRER